MSGAIVIEHVKVSELPEAWRAGLPGGEDARVTVRIEQEGETPAQTAGSAFGMWADRDEMADVDAYVRRLRAARY